jgi:hypothetical protein
VVVLKELNRDLMQINRHVAPIFRCQGLSL